MKVEVINDDDFDVFINCYNFKDIHIFVKDDILALIKDYIIIINKRYRLNLSGFYKVKSYYNKKIGLFLNIIKIDDNDFSDEADFRIILFENEKFLFEVEDYDLVKDIKNKVYYNDMFYVDVNDISSLNNLIDMGRIIYGDDVKKILFLGKMIV